MTAAAAAAASIQAFAQTCFYSWLAMSVCGKVVVRSCKEMVWTLSEVCHDVPPRQLIDFMAGFSCISLLFDSLGNGMAAFPVLVDFVAYSKNHLGQLIGAFVLQDMSFFVLNDPDPTYQAYLQELRILQHELASLPGFIANFLASAPAAKSKSTERLLQAALECVVNDELADCAALDSMRNALARVHPLFLDAINAAVPEAATDDRSSQ